MPFDRQTARELSTDDDRDATRFFAGRAVEIERFEDAFRELEQRRGPQAVFRVYQGAPGSGKTALLYRLREKFVDRATFVELQEEHLASKVELVESVARRIDAEGSLGVRLVVGAVRDAGAALRMDRAVGLLADAFARRKVERLVLHMDEAQVVGPTEQPGLLALHRSGVGVPTVCLFAGLSHTADRFRSLGGLSRLSRSAVVEVGAMTAGECAESTQLMLDALGAKGDRRRAAEAVAKLSLGWPQHLRSAQNALCRELLRTGGDLGRVDGSRVRSESDEARFDYYRARLSGSALGVHPPYTAAVAAEVRRRQPVTLHELHVACGDALAALREADPGFEAETARDFAAALVEKGVLSRQGDDHWGVAIPSMADWLESRFVRRETGRDGR